MVAPSNRRPRPTGIPRYFTDSSDASSAPRHVSKIPKFNVGSSNNNGHRPRPNNRRSNNESSKPKPKSEPTTTERPRNWVLDGTGSVDSDFLLPPQMVQTAVDTARAPPPQDLFSANKKESVMTKRRKFEELMAHMVSKQRGQHSSSSGSDSTLPRRTPTSTQTDKSSSGTSSSKFHQLMTSSVSSPPSSSAAPLSPYTSLKNNMLGLLGANHNIELDSPVPKRRRAHDTTKDRLQSLRQKAQFGLDKLDHHTTAANHNAESASTSGGGGGKTTPSVLEDETSVGILSTSPSVSFDLTGVGSETETSGIYDLPKTASAQSYILGSCSSLIEEAKKKQKKKGSKGSSRASKKKTREPVPPTPNNQDRFRRSLDLPVLKTKSQHARSSMIPNSNSSVTSSPLHLPMSAHRQRYPPLAQQLLQQQQQQQQKLPKDPTEHMRSAPEQPELRQSREPAGSSNNSISSGRPNKRPQQNNRQQREPSDSRDKQSSNRVQSLREKRTTNKTSTMEPSEHLPMAAAAAAAAHENIKRKIGDLPDLLRTTISAAASAVGMIERKESQEPSEHLPSSMRSSIANASNAMARQKPPYNLTDVLRRGTACSGAAIEPQSSQEPSEHLRSDTIAAPLETQQSQEPSEHRPAGLPPSGATSAREEQSNNVVANTTMDRQNNNNQSAERNKGGCGREPTERRQSTAAAKLKSRDDRESLASRRTAAVHKRQIGLSASSVTSGGIINKLEPSERVPPTSAGNPATKQKSAESIGKEEQLSPSSSMAHKKGNRRGLGERRRTIGLYSVAESLKQQKAKLKLHKEQHMPEPSERLLRIMAQKERLKSRNTVSQLEPSSRLQSTAITSKRGGPTIACTNSLVGGVSTVESSSGQTPQTEPPGSSPTGNGSLVVDLSVASPEVHTSTMRINVERDGKTQGSLELSDDNSIQIIDTTSWENRSHGHDPLRPVKLDITKEGDREQRDANSEGNRGSQASSNGREGSPRSGHAPNDFKLDPGASHNLPGHGPDPHGYLSEITSHGGSLSRSARQDWSKRDGMLRSHLQSNRHAESKEIPGIPQRQYSYDFHEIKDSDDAPTVICVLDSEQEENSRSNAGSSRKDSDPFAYIRRNIFRSNARESQEGRKKISTFAQDMKQGRNLKESLRHLRQASKQKKKEREGVRSKKPAEDEEIVFVMTEIKDGTSSKNDKQQQEVVASELTTVVDEKKKKREGHRRKPPLPEAIGERLHRQKPSRQLHLEVTDVAMAEARDEREQPSQSEATMIRAPLLSPITIDDQSTASSCTSTRSDLMTAPSLFSGIVGREIQCCDDESAITDSMAGMSLERDKVERKRASHFTSSHEQYGVPTGTREEHGFAQSTMSYEKLSKGQRPNIPRSRSPVSPNSAKSGVPQQITSLLQSVGAQLVPSVPSGLLALSRSNLSPTGPKWAIHKEHDLAEEVKNMTESMAHQLGGSEAQGDEKNVVERKLRTMEERMDIGQKLHENVSFSAKSRDLVIRSSMQSGDNTPKLDDFYFGELQTKLSDFGSQVSGALQETSSFFPSLYKVPQAPEQTKLPHSQNQADSHRPASQSKASNRKKHQVDAKLGLPPQFGRNQTREVSTPPLNVAIVDSSPIISKFLKRKDRLCDPNRPNSKGNKEEVKSNAPGSYCYSYDKQQQSFTIEHALSGLTGSTEKEQRLAHNQSPPLPSHPFQDFAIETKRMADNFEPDEPSETFSKENRQKKKLFGRLVSPLTLPSEMQQKLSGALKMHRGERLSGQGPDEAKFERKEITSHRRFVKKSREVRRKPCLPPSNIDRSMLDETSEYQSSAWSRSGVSTIASNRPSPMEDDGVSTLGASTQTQTDSYASTFMTSLVVKDTILVKMSSVSESADCTSNSNDSASEGASHSTPSSSSTPLSEHKVDPPSMGEYHAAAAYHAAATCSQPFYAPVESTEEPYHVQPSRSEQEALNRRLLATPSPLSNQFSIPATGPMGPAAEAGPSAMSDSDDEASESSYYFAEHNDQVASGPLEQQQQSSSPVEPNGEQTDSNESSGNMLKKLLSRPRLPKWQQRTNEKKAVGPPPSSEVQKKKREPSVRDPSPLEFSMQDPSTIQEPSFQEGASFQEDALTAVSSGTESSIVKGEFLIPEPHQLERRPPRYYADPMPFRPDASERELGRHQQDLFDEELTRLQSCIDCVDPPGLLMDLTGISFGPRRRPASRASRGEDIDNFVLSSWGLQNRMDQLRAKMTFSPNESQALSPHTNSAGAPSAQPHATSRKNLQMYESVMDSVMEDAERSGRISSVSGASFATFSSFDELSVSRASMGGSKVRAQQAQQAVVRQTRTMDTDRAYVRGLERGTPQTMTKFRSKSWRGQDEEDLGNSIVASNSSNSQGYYGY